MMSQVGHLPFYIGDKRCEVVAIAESRPSLVAALKKQYDGVKIVASHRELLDNPSIEAVIVVAPRPANAPLAFEALQAGKHVMVEKPMAHSVAQALRLVEAARARNAVLAIGFMKRYDPGILKAKALFDELIQSGRVGPLLLARIYDYARMYAVPPPPHTRPRESRVERFPEWPQWPDWLPEQHRNTYVWFLNAASHDVNLTTFFFPSLEILAAHSLSNGNATAVLAAGNAPVVLELAKSAPGRWIEGAEFLFEKGRLAIEIPSPMAADEVSRVTIEENLDRPSCKELKVPVEWSFAAQARGFVDSLLAQARPRTTGEDGLRELEICEAIWRKIAESSS